MKPGTIVVLPDGREGTVVYHGLDGYGIQWGRVAVDLDEIMSGNALFDDAPSDWRWNPDAMLRQPYRGATIECVGGEYDQIEAAQDGTEVDRG